MALLCAQLRIVCLNSEQASRPIDQQFQSQAEAFGSAQENT
jgi:hypothetical protein